MFLFLFFFLHDEGQTWSKYHLGEIKRSIKNVAFGWPPLWLSWRPFLGPSYVICIPLYPLPHTICHVCLPWACYVIVHFAVISSPPCDGRVVDLARLDCWALLLWFLVPKSLSQFQINSTARELPEWSWYTSCHGAFQKGRASLYFHYWISTEYKCLKKERKEFHFYF